MSVFKDFDKEFSKLKDLEQIREHSKDLYAQVVNLTQTVEKQAIEIARLKQIIEEAGEDTEKQLKVEDAEAISRTQLRILLGKSMTGELTTEESKKVDLFSRLLVHIMNGGDKKGEESKVKNLDTQQLLNLVNGKQ